MCSLTVQEPFQTILGIQVFFSKLEKKIFKIFSSTSHMINALNTLQLCKISAKFNEKYVRSGLNSTKYMQVLR